MKTLIDWVREKPELAGLSDAIVREALLKTASERDISEISTIQGKELRRNRNAQDIVKHARAFLRTIYGVFWQTTRKRDALLRELAKDPSAAAHERILRTHPSTRERLPHYKDIYPAIWNITGTPQSILDIASGFNPLSYPLLGCTPKYLANELAEPDARFIQQYFGVMNIQGNALAFDLLTETKRLTELPADVCFAFKTLDGLEARERNSSARILEAIQCQWIVCSFATASLGGSKSISVARRAWLDHLAEERAWNSHKFSVPSESFVILQKS